MSPTVHPSGVGDEAAAAGRRTWLLDFADVKLHAEYLHVVWEPKNASVKRCVAPPSPVASLRHLTGTMC
jgi:hypothetical protein